MNELILTTTEPAYEPDPNYTPPDYVIDSVTDPEGIHACIKHMLPHRRYRLNLILGLLLLVIGPTLIYTSEIPLGIVSLAVGLYSLYFFVTFPSKVAKNQIRKLEEIYDTDTVPSQIVFWPQGIVFNNKLSGGSAKFRWDIIQCIAKNGNYLLFRTLEKQSIILRLEDVEHEAEFIEYIKAHCPDTKFVGLN